MRNQIGLAVLALAAALPVSAEQVNVTVTDWAYGNWGSAQKAVIKNAADAPWAFGPLTEYAGGFTASINGGASFTTFCTDIYQNFAFNPAPSAPYSYELKTAALTQTLWAASPYNSSSYGAVSRLYTSHFVEVNNVETSTAFQLALWELLYEKPANGYQLGNGDFTATGGTSTSAQLLANTWLASLGTVEGYTIQSLYSGGKQDFLVATPVPEPEAYALALVSLGIVAGYTRRRRTKG